MNSHQSLGVMSPYPRSNRAMLIHNREQSGPGNAIIVWIPNNSSKKHRTTGLWLDKNKLVNFSSDRLINYYSHEIKLTAFL